MQQNVFHQPDRAALERVLERHPCDPTGVALRLAWDEGLTRDEMCALTWDGVDLEGASLRLPDRTVPLSEGASRCLRAWKTVCGAEDSHVLVSEKLRRPMAPPSVSRLARQALDGEGMEQVRLLDLRYDFVLRMLAAHDWTYALRVSGLSVTTYRNTLAHLVRDAPPPEEGTERDAEGEEFRLWQVLQSEKSSPAGLALWLSTQMGLHMNEIVALRWEQVDFEAGVLRLPGRELPMTRAVAHLLRDAGPPEGGGRVLVGPRSKKPLSVARLSTMVRTALIRGGVEDQSLRYLRKDTAQEDEKRRLLQYVRQNGSVSRGEAMELLGVSAGVAYSRLNELAFDGALVRVNTRYYPADSVIAPEKQAEAIRDYLSQWGTAYCQDIADLLHIGKRTTARILRRMVDRGELVLLRREKRYTLPKTSA